MTTRNTLLSRVLWLFIALLLSNGVMADRHRLPVGTISERYVPLENGSIIYDLVTELEWMRCSVGQTWQAQQQRCTGTPLEMTWAEAQAMQRPAGWQVPNIAELRSLVYCSTNEPVRFDMRENGVPCHGDYSSPTILSPAFPNTHEGHFWSASSADEHNFAGWYVNFFSGIALSKRVDLPSHVRWVRKGFPVTLPMPPTPAPSRQESVPPAPASGASATPRRLTPGERYTVAHQGHVVQDVETGLMWQRCSLGQQWNAEADQCTGTATTVQWDALATVSSDLAGYNDWRVPTVTELRALVYCSTGQPTTLGMPENFTTCSGNYQRPTIMVGPFSGTAPIWYWTSTPLRNPDFSAWSVSFYSGSVYYAYKHFGYPVRLVRGSSSH